MSTLKESRVEEYTNLLKSVRQLESELDESQSRQGELRQQVETLYKQLMDKFKQRWPPLIVKQV